MDIKSSAARGALFLASFFTFSAVLNAQCVKTATTVVPRFSFGGGTRVEAVIALGRQENICFGMRNLPRETFFQTASVEVSQETVAQIVSRIMADDAIQIRATDSGVLEIVRPSRNQSLFDRTIPSFTIQRAPLQAASLGIQLRLARELDPNIGGFAGSFNPGDRTDLVGPFDEHDRSVEDLLNRIVGSSKGASWIATVPDNYKLTGSPAQYPIWSIIQYDKPASDFRGVLENIGRDYPETKQLPQHP